MTDPAGTLQIDTTTPIISSLVESPSSGDLDAGKTVTLTLNLSEAVTVAGGTPTLTLNDGGTATYSGGSGTSALTFSYTVGAGQNTVRSRRHRGQSQLRDHHRRCRQCRQPVALRPDPERPADRHHAPTVSSVVASGTGISSGTGDLDAGKTVTLTLNLSEAVTVAGGTPTLTLNDGGTATYSGGSGTSALDLQLHGRRRPEHVRPDGDRGQSQRRHHHRRRRQCRQSHRCGDLTQTGTADRHHDADHLVAGRVALER